MASTLLADDPFELHFQCDISACLEKQHAASVITTESNRIPNPVQRKSTSVRDPELGSCNFLRDEQLLHATECKRNSKRNGEPESNDMPPKTKQDLLNLRVKSMLSTNFLRHYADETAEETIAAPQGAVFKLLNNYQDLYFHEENEEDGTANRMRQVYCLHALNHILKTRALIMRNSARLQREQQSESKKGKILSENTALDDDACRDQGFARSKVLMLLPFRETAYRVVNILTTLLRHTVISGTDDVLTTNEGDEKIDTEQQATGRAQLSVMHKQRFDSEFKLDSTDDPVQKLEDRPADFRATFSGNTDDKFCLGIKVTKHALKLYTKFEDADLIIASPLGLRVAMTTSQQTPKTGSKKDSDRRTDKYGKSAAGHQASSGAGDNAAINADFLSSIEIFMIDRADVLYMQNWSHVRFIFEHINRLPRSLNNVAVDVRRIRTWALNDYARYYRQTIVLSSIPHVAFDSLATSDECSRNYEGCVQQWRVPERGQAPLDKLAVKCELSFHEFIARTPSEDAEKRFAAFSNAVLPNINRLPHGVLLFIPSYFDFVRLRNHFTSEDYSFTFLMEYLKAGQADRARTLFLRREKRILLMTGRFHFYHRYRIRGIRHVVFYGLPEHPQIFTELVNMMLLGNDENEDSGTNAEEEEEDDDGKKRKRFKRDEKKASEVDLIPSTVTVLFSKLDYRTMLATLGPERTSSLLSGTMTTNVKTTKFLTQL